MEKGNPEFEEHHSKMGALGLIPSSGFSRGAVSLWSLSHLSTDVLVEHLGGQEELDCGLQDVVAAEEDGQEHLQDEPQHGGVEEVQEEGGRWLGRHWGPICQEAGGVKSREQGAGKVHREGELIRARGQTFKMSKILHRHDFR